MTPTTVETAARPFTWSESLCLPYESAYSSLQKFAWANSSTPKTLLQQLFGRQSMNDPGVSLDLFRGEWIKRCRNPPPPALNLDSGLAGAFSPSWMQLLCKTDTLRFCEECITHGYHSLLFQIEGLKQCPLHDRPLRSDCPSCHAAIPLALTLQMISLPFRCPACTNPLGRSADPTRWFGARRLAASVQQALAPVDDWLTRLSQYQVTGTRAPLSQLAAAGKYKDEPDTVVAFAIAGHFERPRIPDSLIHKVRRPLDIVGVIEPTIATENASRLQAYEQEQVLFRQLTSKLMRRIRQHHDRCLPAADKGIVLQATSSGIIVGQDPHLCPVAAGYYRWHRRFVERSLIARRFDPYHTPALVPLPSDAFMKGLSAQFRSGVATAYVCEALRREWRHDPNALGQALRRFNQQYSFDVEDPDASWLIEHPATGSTRRWVVMGTDAFLQSFNH